MITPRPPPGRPGSSDAHVTRLPISFGLRQNMTSGISANGMPKERNTWLSTRARDGSKWIPITIMAGTMVIARRRKIGDLAVDEALHHHLAGQGPDRRGRNAGGEQRDAEHDAAVRAEVMVESVVHLVQVVAYVEHPARVEYGGRRREHRHVDDTRDPHARSRSR